MPAGGGLYLGGGTDIVFVIPRLFSGGIEGYSRKKTGHQHRKHLESVVIQRTGANPAVGSHSGAELL